MRQPAPPPCQRALTVSCDFDSWLTPPELLKAASYTLGRITCDPCWSARGLYEQAELHQPDVVFGPDVAGLVSFLDQVSSNYGVPVHGVSYSCGCTLTLFPGRVCRSQNEGGRSMFKQAHVDGLGETPWGGADMGDSLVFCNPPGGQRGDRTSKQGAFAQRAMQEFTKGGVHGLAACMYEMFVAVTMDIFSCAILQVVPHFTLLHVAL